MAPTGIGCCNLGNKDIRVLCSLAHAQMRASIKTLFPERECVALVRPMLDEKELASMDQLPDSKLRPEFRQVWCLSLSCPVWRPMLGRPQP